MQKKVIKRKNSSKKSTGTTREYNLKKKPLEIRGFFFAKLCKICYNMKELHLTQSCIIKSLL